MLDLKSSALPSAGKSGCRRNVRPSSAENVGISFVVAVGCPVSQKILSNSLSRALIVPRSLGAGSGFFMFHLHCVQKVGGCRKQTGGLRPNGVPTVHFAGRRTQPPRSRVIKFELRSFLFQTKATIATIRVAQDGSPSVSKLSKFNCPVIRSLSFFHQFLTDEFFLEKHVFCTQVQPLLQ